MSDRPRTGWPDVDALIDAAEAEQRKFDDLAAVNQAENVVVGARRDDLVAELARLSRARHESVGEIFGQLRRSWDVGDAVIDALEGLRPAKPTDDGATP